MEMKLNCVLLVEDDPGHNFLARSVIARTALTKNVRSVSNGREALEYVSGHGKFKESGIYPRPQLVLLDINMPVMSGWEFLREYHKLDESYKQGVMIVMLTTSDNPDELARGRAMPDISDFMCKPLTAEALEGMIRRYFREYAADHRVNRLTSS